MVAFLFCGLGGAGVLIKNGGVSQYRGNDRETCCVLTISMRTHGTHYCRAQRPVSGGKQGLRGAATRLLLLRETSVLSLRLAGMMGEFGASIMAPVIVDEDLVEGGCDLERIREVGG